MFTKKTKRYLMLLAALGLIAIAAGSSGTFASFNAEVSNNNNTFTSGTLFLHDIHGSTECASESGANNSNLGSSNGCATLFNVTLPDYSTTIGGASPLSTGSPITSLPVTAVPQTVKAGDELVVTDGGSNTQYFYATANSNPNDTSIPVESETPNFAYVNQSATVTDDASFAKLQLQNDGSLAATDIKFALKGPSGCVSAAQTTTSDTITGSYSGGELVLTLGSNLTTGIPSGTTISIAAPNAETVTTTQQGNPGDSVLHVTALANAHSTGTSISWAVSFGAQNLCDLPLSVIETNSSYNHVTGAPALGCAFGGAGANGYGCSFDATSHKISDVPLSTSSFQGLTLAGGGGTGNTGTQLSANGSRYFLIAVQSPTAANNSYQNKTASFDLVWHIDQ